MSIAFLISTQGLLQYSKLDSEALRRLQRWGLGSMGRMLDPELYSELRNYPS